MKTPNALSSLLLALLCGSMTACLPEEEDAAPVQSGTGGAGGAGSLPDTGPPPNLDKRPSVQAVDEATDSALGAIPMGPGVMKTEVSISEKSRVVLPPRDELGNRDLVTPLLGHEGRIRYDIDGDGAANDVYTFVPDREEFAFLIWETDGHCHLAWSHYGIARYVFSLCEPPAGTETYLCKQGENSASRSCERCENDACEPCEARIVGGVAQCVILPPDAALPPPDAAAPGDGGPVDPHDGGPVEHDGFLHPDEGVGPGPMVCDTECLNQSGAMCCTMCGCEAEIRCDPVCNEPYRWDCEVGCCFNYDDFTCDGSESPH